MEHTRGRRNHRPHPGSERGSALVLAVFALVLLASMGIALHFVSQTELQMGKSDLEAKKVFYLAEEGLEEGRQNLLTAAGTDSLADQLQQAAGPNGTIDFDPDQVKPVYDESGAVTGLTGFGDDVPLRTLTSLGEGTYAAFLSNDAVDGLNSASDSNDRVVITGIGTGENNAFEMVQAIIEPEFVLPQVPIAAITLLGPSPFFDGGDVDCTATESSCVDDDSMAVDDDSSSDDDSDSDDDSASDDDSGSDDDSSSSIALGLESDLLQGQLSLTMEPGSDDASALAGYSIDSNDDSSASDDDSSSDDDSGASDDDSSSDDDSGASDDDSGGDEPSPSGKSFIGTDCDGAGIANFYAPVVGTIGTDARDNALNGMGAAACSGGNDADSGSSDDDSSSGCGSSSGNGLDNQYVSGGYSDGETFADLTDDSEPTVASTGLGAIDATWTSCQSVHDMMENLRAAAGYVCTGGSCSLPATTPSSVSFIDGDFQADSSTNGNGLLAVTGRLSFDGDASWHGIILAIGKGEFVRTGGAGDGVITGATVAANIAGPDNVYGTADDCTGGENGFAAASYDEADGQQGDTVYCSNDIEAASPLRSYHVNGFRQR
ncbi:MAG: hypothetical protein ACE5ID_06305 [Acidobacteriota bacterium]